MMDALLSIGVMAVYVWIYTWLFPRIGITT